MHKFKVGDKVRLLPPQEWQGHCESYLPLTISTKWYGKIVEIRSLDGNDYVLMTPKSSGFQMIVGLFTEFMIEGV
jgi:hypothetical protein